MEWLFIIFLGVGSVMLLSCIVAQRNHISSLHRESVKMNAAYVEGWLALKTIEDKSTDIFAVAAAKRARQEMEKISENKRPLNS